MLKQGGTIGILGGGQLGRMMAMSAAQLGFRCITFAPDRDSVAAEVCADFFCNKWDDAAALNSFAQQCDVITWEFENVPVAPLTVIEDRLTPHPRALETAQDRLNEKRFVEDLGGTAAAYAKVDTASGLTSAVDRIGAPGILKTRRDGYDGKGQWRIGSSRDADALKVPDVPCIYEGFVEFDAEFSVILVRGRDGEVRFWDSDAQHVHEGMASLQPFRRCLLPSASYGEQVEEARGLAARKSPKRSVTCRRADLRVLCHGMKGRCSTKWPRACTIRATGPLKARSPASSKTTCVRLPACRWVTRPAPSPSKIVMDNLIGEDRA